jgi:dienelactone hydrolase
LRFKIDDPRPLVDDPIGFEITDLDPHASVVVTARWTMAGAACESSGRFRAGANGIVSPGSDPSLEGTYEGVEPYGLWWSAQITGELGPPDLDPIEVTLNASTDQRAIEADIVRHRVARDVEVEDVSEHGLVGKHFRPSGGTGLPAALVVGGSGGGLLGADTTAALLASRGISSMALAFFGLPGLPDGLAAVPLEYFETAVRWLEARPETEGGVAVVGQSRGGELALLLGVTFPQVGAVVAQSPSNVVWGSFGPGSGQDVPAWTVEGRSVPWMTASDEAWEEVEGTSPIVSTPAFLAELNNVEAVRSAEIPVERASCPILMVSGEDDAMWPSAAMADRLVRRAVAHGTSSRVSHLRYPEAGHRCANQPGLPSPVEARHPVDQAIVAFGGTERGNAAAQADSWSKTLEFIHHRALLRS